MDYILIYKKADRTIRHENVSTDRQAVDIHQRMTDRGFQFTDIQETPSLGESQITMNGLFSNE